jgi:plasmid stabilization system protein ParE
MTRRLVVSPEAEALIDAIATWWRSNRAASADLFAQELAEAFATIEAAPAVPQPARRLDVIAAPISLGSCAAAT